MLRRRIGVAARWAMGLAGALVLAGCNPPLPQAPQDTSSPLSCDSAWALRDARQAKVVSLDAFGVPSFLAGQLGCMAPEGDIDDRAWHFLRELEPVLGATGREQMVATQVETDALGQAHVRFQQYVEGLEVVGGEYIVHADPVRGNVLAVGGRFGRDLGVSTTPALSADDAMGTALAQAGITNAEPATTARLVLLADASNPLTLAWSQYVRWESANGPEKDRVFADANTGALLARHPQYLRGLNRRVYNAGGSYQAPGSLVITEGGSGGDSVAQNMYAHLGDTYAFYKDSFNRDSFDNSGGTMHATVHYGSGYNNAYWDGQQLVFGDGDGVEFGPFGNALDIVAHEMTHGVISYTANLTYYSESGALNEAWADIMGASAEAHADGGANNSTWYIGEDTTTPGQNGDAMRYMFQPTGDGFSRDYYPERYTGYSDNGGVHINSGIANLAFYLTSEGGTHPRGKTTLNVPALGIEKAQQIYYRALVYYMTSSTDFEGARNATAQAAQDLYGGMEVDAVHAAWDAVGVPGGPVGNPDPDPTVTELTNGQLVSGLSGSAGQFQYFRIDVPSGQDSLVVEIAGGSGDADVYVRQGALPTTSTYDERPYLEGNDETASVGSPSSGTWYIGVRGYSSYSGLTLRATFGGSDPGDPPDDGVVELSNGASLTGLSGSSGSWKHYRIQVPSGQTHLEISIAGGSGDADLYVRQGAKPDEGSYDYRPYKNGNNETVPVDNPTAGHWYIGVRGYASFNDLTLTVDFEGPSGSDVTVLTDGDTVTGLSGASGTWQYFKVNVPAGAAGPLVIEMSGGSGDADLYVRIGDKPTTSEYDARPYLSGNNEAVQGDNPSGSYYIGIRGYASYSGVQLSVQF